MSRMLAIGRLAVLLSVISISLPGCGLDLTKSITDSGTVFGITQAAPQATKFPAECKVKTPYARATVGMDPVVLDKLDRAQVDVGNRKLFRCVTFGEAIVGAATGAVK